MKAVAVDFANPSGDELLAALAALANPHRLRIVATLAGGRNYVSQLARDLEMSRPLLHLHLQKLEAAGLVVGTLELSEDGKAMKYYDVAPFALTLTAERIAAAARTLTADGGTGGDR
jgi:DNA-binding transcriptional ArsR family regulator